jgi:hypothetical protein
MHLAANKLCEPFLSPLLPFHPSLPALQAAAVPPLGLSSEDGQTSPTSTLSNSPVQCPRVHTQAVASSSVCDEISPTLTNSSPVSNLLESEGEEANAVKDVYSILLKIRRLEYETTYDLFLSDFAHLAKEVKGLLQSYCSQLLVTSSSSSMSPALVKGYQESIDQSFSTILFPLTHLAHETKERFANEFKTTGSGNESCRRSDEPQTIDEKLTRIWRRECNLSLTQIREAYFSKNYFEHNLDQNSLRWPQVLPRSLASWAHYLDSSHVLLVNNNNNENQSHSPSESENDRQIHSEGSQRATETLISPDIETKRDTVIVAMTKTKKEMNGKETGQLNQMVGSSHSSHL